MEKTQEYVKSVFEKWSKKDSNIPKNLLKHLHINTIEEKTNYLFTHDLSSIYNIEREMKNEGDGFKFEDGEVNSDYFDYEKPAKGDWLEQDELIPFKRFRTPAEAIKSSIKTLDCEKTEICPKCDGNKKLPLLTVTKFGKNDLIQFNADQVGINFTNSNKLKTKLLDIVND